MISTVPAVLARLLVLFKEAADPSTEVWGNRPNEEHQIEENVYIGDVSGTREWMNVGRQLPSGREENYSVQVEVEVHREGTDIEGTEARMWEITLQMEEALGNDPTLGLANVQWLIVDRFAVSSRADQEGTFSQNVFEVDVKARI